MPRPLATLTLAALALLAAPATGQDVPSGQERFELFNACRPMGLVIDANDQAEAIGLTEGALQATPESRLRAARLYTEDRIKAGFSSLYVNLNVSGQAFNILITYSKDVTDAFGQRGSATTWYDGATGTHGRNTGYIMSVLSQYLDKFLATYLRVNEAACEAR